MLYETRNALLTHFENLRRHEELKIIVNLECLILLVIMGLPFHLRLQKKENWIFLSFYSTGDKSSFPPLRQPFRGYLVACNQILFVRKIKLPYRAQRYARKIQDTNKIY